ncbi:alpha/beta hydrolase [Streptomyces sp. NPDC006978]|uniref:alpha/beta hydrolase n=1 Tax=unclassified Streptomyces TaxID=2593676 RepID=UPI002AFF0F55|nr:alpha/beta hydrolase [Streptomyces sp. S584]
MTEYTDFHAPEGLRTRGTVLVVPGRGETRATHTRLGRRLAADAYRVRVVGAPDLDADGLSGALTRFGDRLAAAAEDAAGDEDGFVRPLVLVGADTGAAAVAALLGRKGAPSAVLPDAVVLAGIPGTAAGPVGDWEDELDVRTACPAHRGTLTGDTGIRRGALDEAVPEALLAAAYGGDIGVPVLLLTGDADPLADREALVRTAKSLPRARLSVVRYAHHDVLDDMQHRSVAAEVVTFLETVRNELIPVVTVDSSAW